MGVKFLSAIAVAFALATSAQASTNLVTNGDFSQVSLPGNFDYSAYSGFQFGVGWNYQNSLTGWTSTVPNSYNLYFFGDGSETTKNPDAYWTQVEGGQHPNANFQPLSPTSGGFVVLDGDQGFTGALEQTIGGLTSGQTYKLSFSWAASELANRSAPTFEYLDVGFGGVHQQTATIINAPSQFQGWFQKDMYFTATSASQVLSFLSVGPPGNLPPIAFLDNVSLIAVPEPATWGLLVLGFGGLGAIVRRRRRIAIA